MAAVMIWVDPHKASHTAVAIRRRRSRWVSCGSAPAWPRPSGCWPGRRPGRSGLGPLRAPEGRATCWPGSCCPRVSGQPKLGARVRLLAAGDVTKNDPNDARSVAVAALRSAGVREVRADDHAAVLKIWSKRYRDLGRTRTLVVCRLHAVLGELIPGGVPKAITAARAARVLKAIRPEGAVEAGPLRAGCGLPG